MKKTKFWVASTVVMSFVVMSFLVARPVTISAADPARGKSGEGQCYVINVKGNTFTPPTIQNREKVRVEPAKLKVPQGACVVWVNWAKGPEISISFKEGKICDDVTESPVKFNLTPDNGCYVTGYLKMGETSSLRFMQAGTYKYEVFGQGEKEPTTTGEVVVLKDKP